MTETSVLEQQEQEQLEELQAKYPSVRIVTNGCDKRYAVRLFQGQQWWEYSTLEEVEKRIIWQRFNS